MCDIRRSRRDHTNYPMAMDEEDGLSFGYRTAEDVTAGVKRAFRRQQEARAGGTGDGGVGEVGPFVYHAEALTFAFVEHEGVGSGTSSLAR